MLLQSRMHGVLLGRVQIERFGETGFGVRSSRAARPAESARALSENQSRGGDGDQEEIYFHVRIANSFIR